MNSEPSKKSERLWAKRWIKICIGIAGVIVLFFLLLPFGVKYYLTDWLVKNGADSATIEKLSYNPFAAQVTLEGMDVQAGGRSLLHNASMVVNVGITSLFKRDILLEKADYRDLRIDIEQYEDGRWRFGSYTLENETSSEETKEKLQEDAVSAWAFLADSVLLENCSVRFKTPYMDMTLNIEQAELVKFTTRDGEPAGTFSLKGQVNDTPVNVQLDNLQVTPDIRIGGNISISKFNLDELSLLLQDALPTFAGMVGVEGKALFTLVDEKGMQVDYDGTIDAAGPDIGNNAFGTRAESLTWQGKVQYVMPDSGPMTVETDGLLASGDFGLEVPAAELSMEESRIELNGKTLVTIADNVKVENDGSLLIEGVQLAFPGFEVAEESLLWKGKSVYDSNHQGEGQFVSTDGSFDLGEFRVALGDQAPTFATGAKTVAWQGATIYSQKESGKQTLVELDGTLSSGELYGDVAEPSLRFGQDVVELTTKASLSFGDEMDITGNSSLALEQFKLFQGDGDSPLVMVEKLAAAELVGKGGENIAIKDVATSGLKVSVTGNFPLDIDVPEVHLENISTEDLVSFKAKELSIKSPLITALHNNGQLLRFDDLAVTNITANSSAQVTAETVRLDKLVFLESPDKSEKKAALSLGSAELKSISWSGEAGLQGETLQFDDLVTRVIRDKEGVINISHQLAEMQVAGPAGPETETEPASATNEVATDESKAAPIKLKEILVGGKSRFFFEDYTLAVPFITDLVISELQVRDLDSSQPENKSNILLKGEFDKRAPLEITGDISPFKEKLSMDMKLQLKNYPLSSLSAYTVQSVGTALASGQLQLNTEMTLGEDELDMKNKILLKKLETKTISPELAAELDNQLPIPLDAALSILRDSEQNISLSIPLSGPLSDLNVGIADVLVTALSKAIVPAASGYLMYTLGPYGALAYVGMKVGEKMLEVTLPPVVFVVQETALTAEHLKYLERVAKILQDRPETDLQLCPRVASWEFLSKEEIAAVDGESIELDEKDQEKLLELGQQRAVAVQSHLANDYSIDKGRLLICDTLIEVEKKAVPAVLPQL